MKHLFFLVIMLFVSVLSVSAQSQTYYTLYPVGHENESVYTFYKINRSAKKFYFDSDSPSDANMLIKDYKKTGAKESFDLYPEEAPGQKLFHVEFNGDADGKKTLTFWRNGTMTDNYVVGSKQEQAIHDKKVSSTSGGQASGTAAGDAPAKGLKGSVKKTLNKGANLFKKKK